MLVDDATTLGAAGETGDAVDKLSNLQTKVDELASAGRISAESVALLTGEIAAATEYLFSVLSRRDS